MNGILVVNKEKGYTSRDVVNVVCSSFNTKKVGHTGTLDPLAEGVLVLCLGKALKLTELLVSNDKEYLAKVRLGICTDTLDITGSIIKEDQKLSLTNSDIDKVLNKFQGKILQEVPLYSAVHVKGKRLYEYARNKIEVELPKREVEIFEIERLTDIKDNEFSIRCVVSKGTYIRSLIRDIGLALGTYATMVELKRTRQGLFQINDSFTLEEIKNNNYTLLQPTDVLNIPKIKVSEEMAFRIKNGQVLKKFFAPDMAMILDNNDNLLAIYKTFKDDYVKPYKMFI